MTYFYRVLEILTRTSLVPGVCLNLLLIHLIMRYSRPEIGNFKNLLIIFAAYDVFLTILHFVFDPKVVVLPGIFALALDFPYYGARLLTILESIAFMISYLILMLHLLYRYWVIQKPFKLELFSSPNFALALISVASVCYGIVAWLCLYILSPEDSQATRMVKAEFRRKFGRDIEHGWVVADYWPNGECDFLAICAPFAVDALGLFIFIFVVTIASLTYRHISTAFSLSPSAKTAQIRLLATVCVQTFVPMVCVTIPYFSDTTLPAFGITASFIADTTGLCMALFPTFDPIAVIALMKPYRMALWNMVTRQKPKNTSTISITVNTTAVVVLPE